MHRILVVCQAKALAELLSKALAGVYAVKRLREKEAPLDHLVDAEPFQAVLCGISDLDLALEIFEQAAEISPDTRLIPIASSQKQAESFYNKWDANPKLKNKAPKLSRQWLTERITIGDLWVFFPEAMKSAGGETSATSESKAAAPASEQEAGEAQTKTEDQQAPNSGDLVDGYKLAFIIGQGGFGTTWYATNEVTGRRVAMKFIEGDEQMSQELAALRKYIYVADRCKHLMQVQHLNGNGRRLWFVTPLADSMIGTDAPESYKPVSLAGQLDAIGRFPEQEAAGIATGLVEALLTLHKAGLLHGDATPFNILRVGEKWVLGDPGLVRFVGQAGITRNRIYYPDPNAARPFDDLYAVALTIWDMLSGIWEMLSGKERLRPDERLLSFIARSELPTAKFMCRALSANTEHRYFNAQDMLTDLHWLAAKLASQTAEQTSFYELLRQFRGGLPPLK
jgi:hypothetical protein